MNCRFVFTWYNIKHLITRETVNFVSLGSALGNIEILGKKINFFLRDQALSDLLHSLKFCSWKFISLAVSVGISQQWWVTVHVAVTLTS